MNSYWANQNDKLLAVFDNFTLTRDASIEPVLWKKS